VKIAALNHKRRIAQVMDFHSDNLS
jgi:hypothetical protein